MMPAARTMSGKRHVQREDGDERCHGDAPEPAVLESARADAPGREHDDRGDGRLDAVEQPGDGRHVAIGHVHPGQADQDEERRQHEEPAGDDAAPGAMHEPADVGGQLLRLRARQQHAVVQRVQEPVLRNPAAPLDEFLMHDGNLPGRAAEADEAQLQPEDERLRECAEPTGRARSSFMG